ncbi:MAG: 50S ribosomal protein L11 methyltransferase [Steroidobacteraceae bacterium]
MPYLAVQFALAGLDPDQAEELCFAAGALSVTLSDARDDAVLEPAPGEIRLWPATTLQALYAADADPDELRALLSAQLPLAAAQLDISTIEDRVWEREWLRDFHAMRFGRRLWICPHHEHVDATDAVVVHLDPGLAFGTGTHPSTALCLTWLDGHLKISNSVIDYGCGSGVLAIAAALLGAHRVRAFDIDPQALLASAQNAASNGVEDRIQVCASAAELATERCDLLVANILANTLCALAEEFSQLVRPGGRLLLAGVLDHQATAVAEACAPWFDMAICDRNGDWVALAGERHSHVHRMP